MAKRRRPQPRQENKISFPKNEQIRGREVRVVGDNVESDIYPLQEALRMAEDMGLDLVLINPKQQPPICKIADYGKLVYEEKRRQKDQEKRNRETKVELKELRFTPSTGQGDIDHKMKKAQEFLKEGDKVKLTVRFRGRQMAHKELGEKILLTMAYNLSEDGYGSPENPKPQMQGKFMSMVIKPKK